MLLSLVLANTLHLLLRHWILTTFPFREELRLLSTEDVFVVLHAPFCSAWREGGRKQQWQPAPPACPPVWQAQDSGETLDLPASPSLVFPSELASGSLPVLLFWPLFSHHKTSDLHNSYTAVPWKTTFKLTALHGRAVCSPPYSQRGHN